MSATILKCERCNEKWRLYPVGKRIKGVKIKHFAYRLYKERQKVLHKKVQIIDGIDATGVDYNEKGKVICDCPRCRILMTVV